MTTTFSETRTSRICHFEPTPHTRSKRPQRHQARKTAQSRKARKARQHLDTRKSTRGKSRHAAQFTCVADVCQIAICHPFHFLVHGRKLRLRPSGSSLREQRRVTHSSQLSVGPHERCFFALALASLDYRYFNLSIFPSRGTEELAASVMTP